MKCSWCNYEKIPVTYNRKQKLYLCPDCLPDWEKIHGDRDRHLQSVSRQKGVRALLQSLNGRISAIKLPDETVHINHRNIMIPESEENLDDFFGEETQEETEASTTEEPLAPAKEEEEPAAKKTAAKKKASSKKKASAKKTPAKKDDAKEPEPEKPSLEWSPHKVISFLVQSMRGHSKDGRNNEFVKNGEGHAFFSRDGLLDAIHGLLEGTGWFVHSACTESGLSTALCSEDGSITELGFTPIQEGLTAHKYMSATTYYSRAHLVQALAIADPADPAGHGKIQDDDGNAASGRDGGKAVVTTVKTKVHPPTPPSERVSNVNAIIDLANAYMPDEMSQWHDHFGITDGQSMLDMEVDDPSTYQKAYAALGKIYKAAKSQSEKSE